MSAVVGRMATRRQRIRMSAAGVCLAIILTGCSDGTDEVEAAPEDAPDEVVVEDTEDAEEDVERTVEEPDVPDEPAPVDEGPPRLDFGVAAMELTTPASEVGARPELTWEPVEGAQEYRLTLYREDDVAYWAWTGAETAVRVGRTEDLSVGGPRIEAGMTWTVMALDGAGELIAQSGERPIEP